jgi:hypothetical protein
MRVKIVVTNDEGQTFEGEADLAPAGRRRGRPTPARATAMPAAAIEAKVDLGLPLRAFLKKYATGGGPRKFAMLLARLTGGKTGVEVTRETVEKEWARNKGVLGGGFQGMYTTRSKEEGWTDAGKTRGTFVLRSDWHGALK